MTKQIMEASQAVAYAVKQSKPAVIPMYPITPQTHIVEKLAEFIDDGKLNAEMIHVESEFSAISAALGVSASGMRVFTATASQGLALMHEVLHIVSGMRLPVVMAIANRALSAPINIWNDHQDSISARDTGWIQIYVESAQEAYDSIFQAYNIAEHKDVLLPVMVCLDGFTLSHVYEPVDFLSQKQVDRYLRKFRPAYPVLDTKKPVTMGPVGFPDSYMFFRRDEHNANVSAAKIIQKENLRFKKLFGRGYGNGLVETYNLKGSRSAIVCMGSVCGTVKAVIDELKPDVAMIKIRTYRPFPVESLRKALVNIKNISVIDKNISIGYEGAVCTDLKAAIRDKNIKGYIMGLGGRDIKAGDIKKIIKDMDKKQDKPIFVV